MKLINADALREFLVRAGRFLKIQDDKRTAAHAIGKIIEHIDNMQTIDAEPVRHGHWIYNKDTGEIRCNLCNALVGATMCSDDVELITEVENFCFNCGAKMDEVNDRNASVDALKALVKERRE